MTDNIEAAAKAMFAEHVQWQKEAGGILPIEWNHAQKSTRDYWKRIASALPQPTSAVGDLMNRLGVAAHEMNRSADACAAQGLGDDIVDGNRKIATLLSDARSALRQQGSDDLLVEARDANKAGGLWYKRWIATQNGLNALHHVLRQQTDLVERLCNAVDLEAGDIGGSEGSLNVLKLLGPINDTAIEHLTKLNERREKNNDAS